jgi:two-component sensor histidine kinase
MSRLRPPELDDPPYFLRRGGKMGARLRTHDWAATPLGPPKAWPQALRTAVSMMLNSLQPMFVAWGPDLTFLYNDAYAPVLGDRHPAALGARFEHVWADIWPDLRDLVFRAIHGEPVWQEDLPLLMHRRGFAEQTYFTFSYSPLYAETGTVDGMLCTCIETTARVTAERQLRETAEALVASQARYRAQGERLFSLFEKAPGFVAVLEGPRHVFTLANAAYRQLIGHRDVIGLSVREAVPEVAGSGVLDLLDGVYRTGEPYVGSGWRIPLQRRPGAPPEEHVLDFVYQPIRDEDGRVTGIFVEGADVTDHALFAEKQRLLLNELNHRVKNNLATVQSLAAQTARRAPDLAAFVHDFEGRLVALARTHDVLTQNAWSNADLADLLRAELDAVGDRVRLSGPRVSLNANQALAIGLIAHELATNAAKYGALQPGHGVVEVAWTCADERLELTWTERDGPRIPKPEREGFGSRLIRRMAAGDLGGQVEMDYRPQGLRLRLEAPLVTAATSRLADYLQAS